MIRTCQRRTTKAHGRRAAGFTLIEIVVAFAIMAVALAALMQAFSGGLRSVAAAEAHVIATMHARSKMAEVAHVIPLEPGEHAGVFENDFRWAMTIREFETAELDPILVPYEIHVTVSWDGDRAISLSSVRLGAP